MSGDSGGYLIALNGVRVRLDRFSRCLPSMITLDHHGKLQLLYLFDASVPDCRKLERQLVAAGLCESADMWAALPYAEGFNSNSAQISTLWWAPRRRYSPGSIAQLLDLWI